ncbi:hypothetical protein VNO78_32026 [Psophocarpus tetragonolobus]|uniref:Uncharacterized protein n=1 Tax=Psophocarpus tetragonolobus TaxID=3891 RepID=A0AAN9RZ52_PSOTE
MKGLKNHAATSCPIHGTKMYGFWADPSPSESDELPTSKFILPFQLPYHPLEPFRMACDIGMVTKVKSRNCWPNTDKRTINDYGESTGVLPFSSIPE